MAFLQSGDQRGSPWAQGRSQGGKTSASQVVPVLQNLPPASTAPSGRPTAPTPVPTFRCEYEYLARLAYRERWMPRRYVTRAVLVAISGARAPVAHADRDHQVQR